jgi:hypothetical protein
MASARAHPDVQMLESRFAIGFGRYPAQCLGDAEDVRCPGESDGQHLTPPIRSLSTAKESLAKQKSRTQDAVFGPTPGNDTNSFMASSSDAAWRWFRVKLPYFS